MRGKNSESVKKEEHVLSGTFLIRPPLHKKTQPVAQLQKRNISYTEEPFVEGKGGR